MTRFSPTLLLLAILAISSALVIQKPLALEQPTSPQTPLSPPAQSSPAPEESIKQRKLQGRFLHITDLHADPFYRAHASTEEEHACHRGHGAAGEYGAETTDCDSPISLVNATFDWINDNIKDEIDFVVWTGDSARHDNDERLPRTEDQIKDLNRLVVSKFIEVFGKKDNLNDTDHTNDYTIPIIPNYGNNDIMPHNIFMPGPNKWTRGYLDIWRTYIPHVQRHTFENGGYFYVEVIPNKLAVFSLNTLYFFDNNSGVDGCADRDEPGYQQFKWLRIQLDFMRQRGVKVILMGHVAPARTVSKNSWDETCWQKFALWTHQYRDVIVGSLFGHMNIDHFMFQDSEEVDRRSLHGHVAESGRIPMDDEITIEAKTDYLKELRVSWSQLAKVGKADECRDNGHHKHDDGEKSAGPWGERYSLSFVSPSIVPNYFPTLRIMHYNISGIEHLSPGLDHNQPQADATDPEMQGHEPGHDVSSATKHKSKTPKSPSKTAPPGPAYSPQTLTLLGYTQYFANLTAINNDFTEGQDPEISKWKHGKHADKTPDEKAAATEFEFRVEYDTRTDKVYRLADLTVPSYLELATRIGEFEPRSPDESSEAELLKKKKKGKKDKKKKKKKEKKHRKVVNKTWFAFVSRAYVNTVDEDDLHDDFGTPAPDEGDQ